MYERTRYEGDGVNAVWPVGFEFGPGQLSVLVVDSAGNRRRLHAGRDYLVQGGNLIYLAPQGSLLLISRLETGGRAARTRLVRKSGSGGAEAANAAQAGGEDQGSAAQSPGAASAPATRRLATPSPAVQGAAAQSLAARSPDAEIADSGGAAMGSGAAEDDVLADLCARVADLEAADNTRQVADLEARLAAAENGQARAASQAVEASAGKALEGIQAGGEAQAKAVSEAAARAIQGASESLEAVALQKAEIIGLAAENARGVANVAQETSRGALLAAREALDTANAASQTVSGAAAQARNEVQASGGEAVAGIEAKTLQAVAMIDAAARDAQARAARASALPGDAWPDDAWLSLETGLAAGDLYELPLSYWTGRNTLLVFQDGKLLENGKDYEEIGQEGGQSQKIKFLRAVAAGAALHFRVEASNAGQEADISAQAARKAAESAQACAYESRAIRDSLAGDKEKSALMLGLSEAGAQNSGDSAKEAYRLAVSAWEAAWQAEIAAKRPGIAVLGDPGQIWQAVGGLYVVNGQILRAPSVFMGVWPVGGVEDIAWDGVFFIGPAYGDDPALPPLPPLPEKPLEPDNPARPVDPDNPGGDLPGGAPPGAGDGCDWLPCGHRHEDGAAGA